MIYLQIYGVWRPKSVSKRGKIMALVGWDQRATIRHRTSIASSIPLSPIPHRSLFPLSLWWRGFTSVTESPRWTRSRDSSHNWFSITVHLLLLGRPIHEFVKKGYFQITISNAESVANQKRIVADDVLIANRDSSSRHLPVEMWNSSERGNAVIQTRFVSLVSKINWKHLCTKWFK
jgi:hypothetical protein